VTGRQQLVDKLCERKRHRTQRYLRPNEAYRRHSGSLA